MPYTRKHTRTVGLTDTAPPTATGVFSAHLESFETRDFVGRPQPPYPDAQWADAAVNGRRRAMDERRLLHLSDRLI